MSATVRSMKVLLVDDTPDTERAARGQAEDYEGSIGENLAGRGDSIELTRVARLDPGILAAKEFDAVVIDLSLAGGEGFPAFRLARSTVPDLPVFVLTGSREENVGVLAVREGAEDYLIKAVGVGPRLYQSIRYAVSRTRLEKQLKTIEAELRRTEEQLQESRRHEAAGRLAGSVAHDFNNLLTVIVGNCDFILGRLDKQNPIERDVAQIRWSAVAAGDLTRQLVAGATREAAPRDQDLNLMLREAEPVISRILGAGTEISLDLMHSAAGVRVDPGQIEQILMNLVLNARDAMKEKWGNGGRLRITTTSVDVAGDVDPSGSGAGRGEWVKLSVTDDGVGMGSATRARVFEPFFTTKSDGSRRGLGLATVREIVAGCGGVIGVASEEGVGTTFDIHFPRLPGVAVDESRDGTLRHSPVGAETILLVEDSEAVRKVARQSLEAIGYRVLEAESGPAALALLESAATWIDLLLTDVVMPGMSGEKLADVLRDRFPSLGILFISGFACEESVRQRLREKGSYLPKPFTPEALARLVREVLDTRQVGSLPADALQ